MQHCPACQRWVFYPRTHCPHCLSASLEWKCVEPRGFLYSFTVARVPTAPHFADQVPQILAIVQLDEGMRMTSTLVDVDPGDVRIGMRLAGRIERTADRVHLLRFVQDTPPPTRDSTRPKSG